jgi:hypothetical protein
MNFPSEFCLKLCKYFWSVPCVLHEPRSYSSLNCLIVFGEGYTSHTHYSSLYIFSKFLALSISLLIIIWPGTLPRLKCWKVTNSSRRSSWRTLGSEGRDLLSRHTLLLSHWNPKLNHLSWSSSLPVNVVERSKASSLAWKLWSWVRTPPQAWMFSVCVCMCFSVFVYRQRPWDELITRPRSPADCYRSSKWSETESFMEAPKAQIGL